MGLATAAGLLVVPFVQFGFRITGLAFVKPNKFL